tara:strand:+ start:269 stop:538 length:270 start_codon:yes stop_codon:yes gene_type:complete
MEYIGEYRMTKLNYFNLKTRLLKNKSKTSWLTFPNGMRNKVYLDLNYQNNTNNMFIYDVLDSTKKIKIKKIDNTIGLVMYDTEDLVASD